MSGQLVVVGTPLGNLGDLSPRAAQALTDADLIACEDTRRTSKLLSHLGVSKPMLVCNEHTELKAAERVVDELASGNTVVLVSDAGMPVISDPGEHVVRAVVDAGHVVTVMPGPTAVSAALATSGLPVGRYVFEGFLPRKGAQRSERLLALQPERRAIVLYEAPHRAERTLNDLSNVLGPDRRVAVGRELTKMHEQIWRGTLADAVAWAAEGVKGEMVFVIEGAPPPVAATDDAIREELRQAISSGETTRDAVSGVAERLGVARNRAYGLATDL